MCRRRQIAPDSADRPGQPGDGEPLHRLRPVTQIRAVIFDLDGTLIDHVGSVTQALEAWLPEVGATPTEELTAAWFLAEEKHFPAWRSREITFAEQRRRRLHDLRTRR